MPPETPITGLQRRLHDLKSLLSHQSHGKIYVGRSIIDFLDTLERDDFDEAIIHFEGDLPVIHLLEQEINEARAKRQEDFAEFERAMDSLHGNHGRIRLLEVETRLIREELRSKMIGRGKDPQTRWNFSDQCGQSRMLQRCGYNDDPMTWGPSSFAVCSGLADYQISFPTKARKRDSIENVSPRALVKKENNRKMWQNVRTGMVGLRKSSSLLGLGLRDEVRTFLK